MCLTFFMWVNAITCTCHDPMITINRHETCLQDFFSHLEIYIFASYLLHICFSISGWLIVMAGSHLQPRYIVLFIYCVRNSEAVAIQINAIVLRHVSCVSVLCGILYCTKLYTWYIPLQTRAYLLLFISRFIDPWSSM